ncbi:hypothetical protein HPP92_027080 [Vanilla planifolia]|uniref:Uncharacterized protein n=1 Tax=Vanilla planifolia TaxID=51239 RepID=A0A835PBM0_VANPL|nr:hypothetical protein HPP92_027080 [Vanilla planifolia]
MSSRITTSIDSVRASARDATFLQKLAQTLREWCLIAVDCCRGLSFARPPPEVAGWTGVMSDHVRIYKRNIKEECGGTSS